MLYALALALLLVAVVLGLTVDDWSRDLTTNVAETSRRAADPVLRPVTTERPVGDVVKALRGVVRDLPNWSWASDARDDSVATVRLVRSTRFLRFKDDVTVRVIDRRGARLVHAISRSRVGRGDLGQNPRNLKELFGMLRTRLAAQ